MFETLKWKFRNRKVLRNIRKAAALVGGNYLNYYHNAIEAHSQDKYWVKSQQIAEVAIAYLDYFMRVRGVNMTRIAGGRYGWHLCSITEEEREYVDFMVYDVGYQLTKLLKTCQGEQLSIRDSIHSSIRKALVQIIQHPTLGPRVDPMTLRDLSDGWE